MPDAAFEALVADDQVRLAVVVDVAYGDAADDGLVANRLAQDGFPTAVGEAALHQALEALDSGADEDVEPAVAVDVGHLERIAEEVRAAFGAHGLAPSAVAVVEVDDQPVRALGDLDLAAAEEARSLAQRHHVRASVAVPVHDLDRA